MGLRAFMLLELLFLWKSGKLKGWSVLQKGAEEGKSVSEAAFVVADV